LRRISSLPAAFACLCLSSPVFAQFGKNKVQYQEFHWKVERTRHFDVYFAQGGEAVAQRAVDSLEGFYERLVQKTGMHLEERVPILLYDSHPKFQQTNVTDEILQEGVGGFTEIFRNRIVVPFQGSYRELDHVLAHEMVHAVMFDAMRQESGSALAGAERTRMPLWFTEGLAEYVSLDGWDLPSDMWLMDAVTSGYLPMPTVDMQGFLAYRAGQNFLYYCERTFGAGTVRELVQETLRDHDLEKAFQRVTKVSLRDAGEEWIRDLRWDYWPELGIRQHGSEVGRILTRAGEDGSFWNMQPAIGPDGSEVAWFSDRGARQGLYVGKLDELPREKPRRVLEGGGTTTHESFSPFTSGLSWSPDGRRIVVAAQTHGSNALHILDARSGRVRRSLDPGFDGLSDPDWSRDGNRIVFRGLLDGRADLWLWDLVTDSVRRLTDDAPDDDEPAFSPSGRWVAWSSEADSSGGIGRHRSIWILDISTGSRRRISASSGDETRPSWGGASDDSSRIAFLSDRSGLPQVYLLEHPLAAGGRARPATDLLTGVQCPKLARDGNQLVFSLFEGGSFDLYLSDTVRALTDSVLARTRYVRTEDSGRLDIFRPLVRQNLESFRFDTADRDSAKAAKDSLKIVRRDSLHAPMDPTRPGDRLFGASPEKEAVPAPAARKPGSVDTASTFPPGLPARDSSGRLVSKPYRARWGLDHAALAFGFSSYEGTAGEGMFSLSDLMGDQTIDAMLDVQGSLTDANVFLRYGWLPWRTDLFATVYHTSTFTGNILATDSASDTALYDDQLYGAVVTALYPFSVFHRVDASLEWGGIQRTAKAYDSNGDLVDDPAHAADDRDLQWLRASGEWVFDNVIWGPTGPWDGVRANLAATYMPPLLRPDYGYALLKTDVRGYFPTGKISGLAVRVAGGESFRAGAADPHSFLLGGDDFTLNWHFNEANSGVGVDQLYFSDLDVPLRGYRYDQFRGDKEMVANIEYRFPFVEEVRFGALLPPLHWLMGSVFLDAGSAWTSGQVVDQGGVGLGWGLGLNLGAFILRWSEAWALTDPAGTPTNIQPKPIDGSIQYWSLGADF